MKTLFLTLVTFFTAFFNQAVLADTYNNFGYDGNKIIFVEGNVEFSVFPDGQFDFVFLGHEGTDVTISNPNMSVTFNSGYNYDAYVQYDMYGAVIQIENVPIYYDDFGRIVRAGNVSIRYKDRRLVQVGGLYIHYNPYGYYSHFSGYINPYNRYYVYRPWHVYYAIPYYHYCVVQVNPYRRYYQPVRYSYSYHVVHYSTHHYSNGRRDFYVPGSRVHYKDGRTAVNTNYRNSDRGTATTYRRDDTILRNTVSDRRVSSNRSTDTQGNNTSLNQRNNRSYQNDNNQVSNSNRTTQVQRNNSGSTINNRNNDVSTIGRNNRS